SVFRKTYTREIPAGAERTADGWRWRGKNGKWINARVVEGKPGRCLVEPPTWYGWGNGEAVELNANKQASEIMLGEMLRKAAMGEANAVSPYQEHHKRPLSEHLADYRLHLQAEDNTPRYVKLVASRLQSLFTGCGFERIPDIDAGKVE